jgi:hypothetical protein
LNGLTAQAVQAAQAVGTVLEDIMKNWLKKIEDEMSAIAFAEAGEFETARAILKEQRKILLALTGEKSDSNAFKYALNMCNRIGADLKIICSRQHKKGLLNHYKGKLNKDGIQYKLIKVDSCVKEEILQYTSKETDILFVVVESSDGLNLNCKKSKKIVSESWTDLKCPLVVVSDLATA